MRVRGKRKEQKTEERTQERNLKWIPTQLLSQPIDARMGDEEKNRKQKKEHKKETRNGSQHT